MFQLRTVSQADLTSIASRTVYLAQSDDSWSTVCHAGLQLCSTTDGPWTACSYQAAEHSLHSLDVATEAPLRLVDDCWLFPNCRLPCLGQSFQPSERAAVGRPVTTRDCLCPSMTASPLFPRRQPPIKVTSPSCADNHNYRPRIVIDSTSLIRGAITSLTPYLRLWFLQYQIFLAAKKVNNEEFLMIPKRSLK